MIVEAECIISKKVFDTCDAYLCFDDGATWPAKIRPENLGQSEQLVMCYVDLSGIDRTKLQGIFWKLRDAAFNGKSDLELKDVTRI